MKNILNKKGLVLVISILICVLYAGNVEAINVESTSLFHYIMGMLYLYDGEVDKTIEEFERAVNLNDSSLLLHKSTMELYFSSMDYDKTEEEAKKRAKTLGLEFTSTDWRKYQTIREKGEKVGVERKKRKKSETKRTT